MYTAASVTAATLATEAVIATRRRLRRGGPPAGAGDSDAAGAAGAEDDAAGIGDRSGTGGVGPRLSAAACPAMTAGGTGCLATVTAPGAAARAGTGAGTAAGAGATAIAGSARPGVLAAVTGDSAIRAVLAHPVCPRSVRPTAHQPDAYHIIP